MRVCIPWWSREAPWSTRLKGFQVVYNSYWPIITQAHLRENGLSEGVAPCEGGEQETPMRVALASAAYETHFRSGENLGLRYLASYLEQEGHEVDVYDLHASSDLAPIFFKRLQEDVYPLVGIGVLFTSNITRTISLAEEIRKASQSTHITIGGQGASFIWEQLLSHCPAIDSCVCFEGEQTLSELVTAIEYRKSLEAVRGIFFRSNGSISSTGYRAPISDLDIIPFPKRDANSLILGDPHFAILGSRGCYAQCTFCASGNFGNKYHKVPRWRVRSVANIIAEMNYLITTFSAQAFSFVDDDFLGACDQGGSRADDLIDGFSGLQERLKWSAECRVDEVSLDLFERLHSVGLEHLLIGIDTGNVSDLKLFGKGATLSEAERAISILRELRISMEVGFIMFHPTTTLDLIDQNLAFLERNHIADRRILTNRLEIYEGSPLVRYYSRLGLLRFEDFMYKYRFREPLVEVLRSSLLHVLAPFKSLEADASKARFRLESGIGNAVGDFNRETLDRLEKQIVESELSVARETYKRLTVDKVKSEANVTLLIDSERLASQLRREHSAILSPY